VCRAAKEMNIPHPDYFKKPMASFLERRHSDQLHSILSSPDSDLHFPLFVEYYDFFFMQVLPFSFIFLLQNQPTLFFLLSFAEFIDEEPRVGNLLIAQPDTYLRVFDEAAIRAQVRNSLFYLFILISKS